MRLFSTTIKESNPSLLCKALTIVLVFLAYSFMQQERVHAWSETDVPVHVQTIGGYTGNGQFNYQGAIQIDALGKIYVADSTNNRIQVFDSSGVFQMKFGSAGSGDGQFNIPRGVTVDSTGRIYVADSNNHRIQAFDSNGSFLFKFGSAGSGDGQFSYPNYLETDSADNIYVSDYSNHRIQVFNGSGVFQYKFGSSGTGNGQLRYPRGLHIDSSGKIYVADSLNDRVQVFNNSGVYQYKFGSSGTGDGQLSGPTDIELDATGNIAVVESTNNRVSLFDNAGVFQYKFGVYGMENGQLRSPQGIAIDNGGNMHVSDYNNHRVQVFNNSGVYQNKFGSNSGDDGSLNFPVGMAVDNTGNIYLADYGNNRVQVFDHDWVYQRKFGSYGAGDGQFNRPICPKVNSVGNIYVSDYINHRVQVFNSNGEFLFKFGGYGAGDGQFNYPGCIAIDTSGNIYVVDRNNKRIQMFNSSGVFQSKFGSSGSGNGQFNGPFGIALDNVGKIYVTDTNNHRVQVFDSNGVFQYKFGSYGTSDGQLYYPYQLTLDSVGNIYVADGINNRIQVFNNSGTFLYKFGSSGMGNGQFTSPMGITVSSDNKIHVADTQNHRIQIFQQDRIGPTGSVAINDGTAGTNTLVTELSTTATDALSSVTHVMISEDAGFVGASWETYAASKSHAFSGPEGVKTVYAKYKDTFGTESSTYSDTIIYDVTSPIGSATVNDGAPLTNTTTVTMNLAATDTLTSVTHMKISNAADFSGASWEAFATSKAHTLTTGDGAKAVYVKFKDTAGNESETYSSTITLDTTKPTTRITDIGLIDNVPDKTPLFYYFTSQTPHIKGTTEANSTVHFTYEGTDTTAVANAEGEYEIDIPELPREYVELEYYGVDLAGNKSSTRLLRLTVGIENFPTELPPEEGPVETPSGEVTPTTTESETPTIQLYGIQITDQNGTLLANTAVYIDGQKYVTDKNGKIFIEKKPTEEMTLEVEINGQRVKGSVMGEKIVAEGTMPDDSKKGMALWLKVPLWIFGLGGIGYGAVKLAERVKPSK